MRKLSLPLVVALLAHLTAEAAATHWVNDNDPNGGIYVPSGTGCNDPGYPTIQSAVTAAAASGDTVVVCAGTYPENVTITSKSLRVLGAGVGASIVTGVPGSPGPIFGVLTSSNVTIERLTVDGMSALAGGVAFGIRYDGSNGTIKNVAVLNIRDGSGGTQGLGVRVQALSGPSTVRVEHSLVQNFTRVGISGNGSNARLYVRNNTVIGPVAPKMWAPNGIQISRDATALVTGNSVRDATSPVPAAGAGSGILLFCAGPTTVEGNLVTKADLGVSLSDNRDGRVRGNVVRDSVFEAYTLEFLGMLFGDLGCAQFPSLTQHNLLKQNLALKSGENGISLASFDPVNPAPPTMNDIVGNFVRVSGMDGIHVFDGVANNFIGNSIAMSGDFDCEDDTVGPGTAGTANSWRGNRGTTSMPAGLCTPGDDRDPHDDDDFDDDGRENHDDDDDDNDNAKDHDDDDDDNDRIADNDDIDDDNDQVLDAVDDIEALSADSLLRLSVPAITRVHVTPH